MPTYQVTCAECGNEKWPSLPERPERYVCVLCRMVGPATLEARRAQAARGRATRTAKGPPRPSQDPTGGVA